MTFVAYMLLLTMGVFIGLILPYYATKLYMYYEKNKMIAPLIPREIYQSRMCTDPHQWIEAVSVDDSFEYKPLNVCGKCGFIPSRNLMATKEGLQRIIDNHAVRQFEESVKKDFEDRETLEIRKFIEEFKLDTSFEKAAQLYSAGQSANKRYIMYKIVRSEEKTRRRSV